MAEMTMVKALNLALREAMSDERVCLLGEDVGVGGGIFRVTDGLLDDFGKERVMDTPLAESGIVGFAIGMALAGLRPVAELQFSGFSYFAWHQLESHAARLRWRSRGRYSVPLVVRMPYGAGVRALEHHSESREVMFAHTPGLKVVLPSGPRNARALLLSAIQDPDPVVFLEPKLKYRSVKEEVPKEQETLPLGKAKVVREGDAITFISYGAMLSRAMEAAKNLGEGHGVEVEVIDLLTLSPLDSETIAASVRKTGHAVVIHEAPQSFGTGAEIVAQLVERSFLYLEAPVMRVTGYDVHVPYFARERDYLPDVARITDAARASLNF